MVAKILALRHNFVSHKLFLISFKKILQDTEKKLLKERENILELKTSLDLLTNSLSWRFIQRYYRIRDKLLPDRTNRRNLYNKIIENLKKGT